MMGVVVGGKRGESPAAAGLGIVPTRDQNERGKNEGDGESWREWVM